MKACIFSGSTSVLVNGSPIDEIKISKGIGQGDPLAPFLFLIAAEGLSGLVRRAMELGKFKPFGIGGNQIKISHLQFADDKILLGEPSFENLWALKTFP